MRVYDSMVNSYDSRFSSTAVARCLLVSRTLPSLLGRIRRAKTSPHVLSAIAIRRTNPQLPRLALAHRPHAGSARWRGAVSVLALGALGLLPGCRFLDDAGRAADDVGRIKNRPSVVPEIPQRPKKDWTENVPDPLRDPRTIKDVYDLSEKERCKRDIVC